MKVIKDSSVFFVPDKP